MLPDVGDFLESGDGGSLHPLPPELVLRVLRLDPLPPGSMVEGGEIVTEGC